MGLFFRLPFLLLQALWRHFARSDHDHEDARFAPPAPAAATEHETTPGAGATFTATAASASANGAPPPTAEEAIERRFAREAADVARAGGGSDDALRPIGDAGHVDREAELVDSFGPAGDVGDVGGTLTVDEPWDGYAGQHAAAVVERLRGADPATKAVVALYERAHKNRATVLRATG